MARQSPAKFWLLVTATLCADAAAVISVTNANFRSNLYYLLNVWSALILAQVSVTAIWLVFRQRLDRWSWIVPPVVLLAASLLRTKLGLFGGGWTTLDYACRTALQMLMSIVLLWFLPRIALWGRWWPTLPRLKWEFSLRQMLGWTTVVAVMSALIARASWSNDQPVAVSQTIGVFAPSAIAVGVVVLATSALHWLARLAGYLLVGAAVALTLASLLFWYITDRLLVEFISEALIVAAWVEWGGIIPRVAKTAEAQPLGSIS
jgi:hypothetical protein